VRYIMTLPSATTDSTYRDVLHTVPKRRVMKAALRMAAPSSTTCRELYKIGRVALCALCAPPIRLLNRS
jgi:hypothetical protein